MKKLAIISLTVLCVGCTTPTPVKPKFPDAPSAFMTDCPQLETIDQEKVVFSELIGTVAKNYTTYHECAATVEAWQTWYTKQRKIYESTK